MILRNELFVFWGVYIDEYGANKCIVSHLSLYKLCISSVFTV